MNAHFKPTAETVLAEASWPERWDAFKNTMYWRQALLTIANEAAADGIHQDNELAAVAFDAAYAADAYDRATFIEDVERIFAEYAEAEVFGNRCYRYEQRTGRDWDAGSLGDV